MAKIYRTIQADTFDTIAFRQYGSEHLCAKLMAANPEYMDVLLFAPGVELDIPELATPKKTASLPPWHGSRQ